ncbi:MAG: zf-HC2 domain-containing protein [Nitrospinae bacterium]|nr:zf-HC2 domain-containing protein [Nitrospinota bacterium]
MKCKEIREILLTDYLDDMLNEQDRKEVEAHLSFCIHCNEFAKIAIESTAAPFKDAPKLLLSQEKIWHKIRAGIISEEKTTAGAGFLPELAASFKNIFVVRTALAAAAVAVIVVAAIVFFNPVRQNQTVKKTPPDESIRYLASAMDELSETNPEEDKGYGTDIEKYFL